MNVTFFDREDEANPLNGTVARHREQLLQILNGLRNRPPFVCELLGENGLHLHVGIGKLGHAQYSRSDGEPPYLLAMGPRPGRRDEYVDFLLGGTPTPISKRYCMPFDSIREIAAYFLETGRAHPSFAWEEF
jgi:Immunity protein Imm1